MATKRKRSGAKSKSVDLSMHERVATLETVQISQVEMIKDLSRTMEEVKLSLERYRGFWGAVTLIASAVWAAFALFKDNIASLFTGGK